jgi:hypothetical protein
MFAELRRFYVICVFKTETYTMKLLTALLLIVSFSVKAQTTQEVYNYISAGYKTTLQQGLDFKKGYAYKELIKGGEFTGTLSNSRYQFSYRIFYKENEPNNTLAFMVVLLKNGSVEDVFCLPSYGSDQSFFNKFWGDVNAKLYADQKNQLVGDITQLFTLMAKTLEKK